MRSLTQQGNKIEDENLTAQSEALNQKRKMFESCNENYLYDH